MRACCGGWARCIDGLRFRAAYFVRWRRIALVGNVFRGCRYFGMLGRGVVGKIWLALVVLELEVSLLVWLVGGHVLQWVAGGLAGR